jgi:hypothetical protein
VTQLWTIAAGAKMLKILLLLLFFNHIYGNEYHTLGITVRQEATVSFLQGNGIYSHLKEFDMRKFQSGNSDFG